MPYYKTITCLEAREHGEYIPTNLAEFIGYFQNIYTDIPPEHRHTAFVDVSAVSDYDGYTVQFKVRYTRPETDEEIALRNQAAQRATLESQERERALYEKLKSKYEKQP